MRSLTAALAAILAAGCLTSTDVESMVRPEWESETFDRVVVYYGSSDLEDRKQVEDRFVAKDSTFVPSYELFFVGQREWSKQEVREKMAEEGADAALILNPKRAGSTETTIQGETTTRCTLMVDGDCRRTTTTGGPVTFSEPNAEFGAVLMEWESEQIVWAASAESEGNAFTDQGNLRESFVDAVVESLRKDGLLPERPE